MPGPRVALLVGATGLVGAHLLKHLVASACYERVTAWVRRPIAFADRKLGVEMIDFDRIAECRVAAEDVYCCLGTTIRQAGSQDAFRKVDCDYPVGLAQCAARDGARRLLVVSALGANPRSAVFYNRVKGEMEQAVLAARVSQTYLFRPSLLVGLRQETRTGERIGALIGAALGPLLGKYRPIHADMVARAMLHAAARDLPPGVFESDQIRTLSL